MTSASRRQVPGLIEGPYAELIGRALLDSNLVAVMALDEQWLIVEFNDAAEMMFGRHRDEAIGMAFDELIVAPILRSANGEAIRRHLIAESSLVGALTEQTALHAGGTSFPIELSLVQAGSPIHPTYVGFIRDISSRRQSEYVLAKSQALLAEAEELAGSGSFERDLRSTGVVWSDGIFRILGLPKEAGPPTLERAIDIFHPDDRQRARERLRALVADRREEFLEIVRIVRSDGSPRLVEIHGKLLFDDFGEPERLVGTARDVTDEQQARRDRDLLSYVVESSEDAIITESADGLITSWNNGATQLYGYSADEAIGRHISLIAPPGLTTEQSGLTRRVFAGEAIHHLETTQRRKDGSEVAVSLTASPVRDQHGEILSAAVIARDVTERRRYEQRLQYLAEHDHLTGLLNRRRFEEELSRELARASRAQTSGAVLSVDLDGFKAINDSAGHAAGDAVLREVARTLSRNLRETDIVARLGGDEFAILLPNTGPEPARKTAEHLLEALHSATVLVDGTPLRPTASVGVALFDDESGRPEELIVDADLAMYAAKSQGRDQIVAFSHSEAQAARNDAKLSWAQRIRTALEEDGLELHWQPIVELATGEESHGELLLRMRSGGRLLPPLEFLGAAERLGLIHAIDRWVVARAIAMLADGRGPAARPLSVNLSGDSVAGDADLLRTIERELDRTGVDPSMLIFEITETAAIANIVEARAFADRVRSIGCRLALDDFGTGFGSFYHLKHLPVDFIKIDREFIHGLPRNHVDQRLVQAIVDVAHALGIRTIAESVGDGATIDKLRGIGVDYVQGFFVAKPAPVHQPPRAI